MLEACCGAGECATSHHLVRVVVSRCMQLQHHLLPPRDPINMAAEFVEKTITEPIVVFSKTYVTLPASPPSDKLFRRPFVRGCVSLWVSLGLCLCHSVVLSVSLSVSPSVCV